MVSSNVSVIRLRFHPYSHFPIGFSQITETCPHPNQESVLKIFTNPTWISFDKNKNELSCFSRFIANQEKPRRWRYNPPFPLPDTSVKNVVERRLDGNLEDAGGHCTPTALTCHGVCSDLTCPRMTLSCDATHLA